MSGEELTKAQEGTLAVLQDLVGLSGFDYHGRIDAESLPVRVTLLPINIGQRLHVVPYDVIVDGVGSVEVVD